MNPLTPSDPTNVAWLRMTPKPTVDSGLGQGPEEWQGQRKMSLSSLDFTSDPMPTGSLAFLGLRFFLGKARLWLHPQ